MLTRKITPHIEAALADTPVVLVHGPRQAGKSTLVQYLATAMEIAQYFTFDEARILSLAKADPEAFLAGLTGPIIIDEVQRVPEIFLAIKLMVDRNRKPGQFLLTGSANVLLLPQMADSLAGRMEMGRNPGAGDSPGRALLRLVARRGTGHRTLPGTQSPDRHASRRNGN